MSNEKNDNPKCADCGERTALVKGYYHYSPDDEPYKSGTVERALIEDGTEYLTAFKCDYCGHIQDITKQ